ncbi:DUF4250 domain-containing protein [Lachnospiraceae bacterium LCP25S3_G4]
MENLPKDPIILLSVMNTKLRDYYKDLDELCKELQLDKQIIQEELEKIDYEYDRATNQFV